MSRRSGAVDEAQATDAASPAPPRSRLGPASLIVLSAWCGLVAGLLEVGDNRAAQAALRRESALRDEPSLRVADSAHGPGHFRGIGVGGCIACWVWPPAAGGSSREPCAALVFLPVFLVAFPRIYGLAWLAVTLGLAAQARTATRAAAPRLPAVRTGQFADGTRGAGGFGRVTLDRRPAPAVARAARAMPPPGSPNVLLIVLDTVAAGHLSLYGYERATSTTLTELAERGIRFDSGPGPVVMDPAIACKHVYRAMVARAIGRVVESARRNPSHARRVSRGRGATRRPASSPTPPIAPAIQVWPEALLITVTISFPSSPRCKRPC